MQEGSAWYWDITAVAPVRRHCNAPASLMWLCRAICHKGVHMLQENIHYKGLCSCSEFKVNHEPWTAKLMVYCSKKLDCLLSTAVLNFHLQSERTWVKHVTSQAMQLHHQHDAHISNAVCIRTLLDTLSTSKTACTSKGEDGMSDVCPELGNAG